MTTNKTASTPSALTLATLIAMADTGDMGDGTPATVALVLAAQTYRQTTWYPTWERVCLAVARKLNKRMPRPVGNPWTRHDVARLLKDSAVQADYKPAV